MAASADIASRSAAPKRGGKRYAHKGRGKSRIKMMTSRASQGRRKRK